MKLFASPLALIFFAFGLLLLGCHKQKAIIHNKLAGTWLYETNFSGSGKFTSTVTVSEDGKYFGHLTTLGRSNIFREFDIEGTWQIQDGFLIDTMTKHSGQTNVNLHSVCRAQIIQFSDQELVTKFEENNPKDSNDGHVTIFQKTKD